MMRHRLSLSVVAVAVLALVGCNQSSFSGGVDKKAADATPAKTNNPEPKATQKTLKLACKNGQAEAKLVTEVRGQASTTVHLEGEFCDLGTASKKGDLTVLFVLDYSGSMRENDPEVAGSCGRLQAGQAILNKLEASPDLAAADIKIALQAFGSAAMSQLTPQTLDAFKASLTPAVFCRDDGRSTNYEAAFKASQDLLTPLAGNKVVYFITDGAPTIAGVGLGAIFAGNQSPQQVIDASLTAANALRANVKDLTMNVIFLGNVDVSGAVTIVGFDPQAFLAQIAGSKDNLRVVTNADDLAAKIVTFNTPTAADFTASSVEGRLEATNFNGKAIKVASLTPVAGKDGTYAFVTEAFELFGSSEKVTDNVLTLSIKGADGQVHTAVAEIKFTVDESAN